MRHWLLPLLLAMPTLAIAEPITLTYREQNRWVAEADNAPLQTLYAAIARGTRQFKVTLPTVDRELALERLAVLGQLLAARAKGPVVLAETSGSTPAHTLLVKPAPR